MNACAMHNNTLQIYYLLTLPFLLAFVIELVLTCISSIFLRNLVMFPHFTGIILMWFMIILLIYVFIVFFLIYPYFVCSVFYFIYNVFKTVYFFVSIFITILLNEMYTCENSTLP